MREVTIGEAARASGVKVTTIRFYEERGLLPVPPRSEGGQRLYGKDEIARLRFIRHARDLGFDMVALADLLDLAGRPGAPCANADRLARRRLDDVRRRIAALRALETELARMLDACSHGQVAQCAVIETLADHGRCSGPHGGAEPEGAIARA
jgi:DNA-binding transcriptional MerR regulator